MSILEEKRKRIEKICSENQIDYLGVFGSAARESDFTDESDIDLMIRFGARKSLFDLMRIERELKNVLGRKVDVVTEQSVSPYIRTKIMQDLHPFYERT